MEKIPTEKELDRKIGELDTEILNLEYVRDQTIKKRIKLYGEPIGREFTGMELFYFCDECSHKNSSDARRCSQCRAIRPHPGTEPVGSCGATNPFPTKENEDMWDDNDSTLSNQGKNPHCVDHSYVKIANDRCLDAGVNFKNRDLHKAVLKIRKKPLDKGSDPEDFNNEELEIEDTRVPENT